MRVRKRQEDIQAQVHAAAEHDLRVAQQSRDHLESEQQSLLNKAVVSKGESINKARQLALHQYERYTAQRIVEQDAVIRERTKIYDEQHAALKDAMVLRKMMETLTKHSREALVDEWNRQERYGMDEVATQRAVQKNA